MSCYGGNLLQSIRCWPFWGRPPFVPIDMQNLTGYAVSFRMTHWLFIILQFIYFFLFTFCFQHNISLRDCLNCTTVQSIGNFLFPRRLSLKILHPIIGPFIFRVLGFPSPVVEPGLVLCTRCILHSCCVKWPFGYLVRWLPYIQTIIPIKLIYVIKVAHLFFFLDWHATFWIWLTSMVLILFKHKYPPISMWKPSIYHVEGWFQSGTFFLT